MRARRGSCKQRRLFHGTLLQLPEPGQNLTSPDKLWFSLSGVSLESHVQNTLRRKVQEWTSDPGGSRRFPDCWQRRMEDGTTPGSGAGGGDQHFTLNVRSCELPPHPEQSDGGNAGVSGADGSLFALGLFQQRKSRAVCPCAKYPRKWPQMVGSGHPKSSPAPPQPLSPSLLPRSTLYLSLSHPLPRVASVDHLPWGYGLPGSGGPALGSPGRRWEGYEVPPAPLDGVAIGRLPTFTDLTSESREGPGPLLSSVPLGAWGR